MAQEWHLKDKEGKYYKVNAESREEAIAKIQQYKQSQTAPPSPQEQGPRVPAALGGFEGDDGQMLRELGSGIEQFGYNAGILALRTARGIVPDGLAPEFEIKAQRGIDKLTQAKRNEEFAIAEQFAKQWDETPSEFMIMVGQELPLLPLAFIPGLQGSTLFRAAAFNGLQGSLAGAIASAEEDPWGGATLGGVLGVGATYFMGGLPGMRAYIGRKWAKQADTAEAKQRLALERKIQEETGDENFSFSMGQIAQENPYLVSAERGAVAGNRKALERQRKNLQTIVDYLETKSGSIADRAILAKELGNTMKVASDTMHGIANRNYQRGMAVLSEEFGDDILIDGHKYLDDLETLLVEDMGIGSGKVPKAVQEHIDKVDIKVRPAQVRSADASGKRKFEVLDRETGAVLLKTDNVETAHLYADRYNKAKGGLTVDESVAILKSHNQLISGERSVFDTAEAGSNNHLGKFLKSSMLGSLRGQSSGAVNLLTKINNAYAYDMQMIRQLKNSHLGRLFGGDPTLMTPNEALEQLLGEGTDRASLAATRKVLQSEAPDLLYDLQRQQIREVLSRGRSGSFSSADLEADINLLMTALSGKGDKSNVGKVGMGLFSPREQQHLINAAKSLSVLRTTYLKTGQSDVGAANLAADIGINLVSRSAEFVSRLLVRLGSRGSTIAELMTDPKARASIIALAEAGPNTARFRAAATFLGTWVGQVDAEEQAKAQAEADRAAGVESPGGA